jgi:ankyrin repeat protein
MSAAGIGSIRLDTRGVYRNEKDGIEVAKLLLAAGADINATDDGGQTALYGAASWGWNDMVTYLVERGASLTTIDDEGHNVVDAATGKAGGPVRLGIAPQIHEDTAALLKKLIADKARL